MNVSADLSRTRPGHTYELILVRGHVDDILPSRLNAVEQLNGLPVVCAEHVVRSRQDVTGMVRFECQASEINRFA